MDHPDKLNGDEDYLKRQALPLSPFQTSHVLSSTMSASADPDEDWIEIGDLVETFSERRQNRFFLHNYQEDFNRHLEDLQSRSSPSLLYPKPPYVLQEVQQHLPKASLYTCSLCEDEPGFPTQECLFSHYADLHPEVAGSGRERYDSRQYLFHNHLDGPGQEQNRFQASVKDKQIPEGFEPEPKLLLLPKTKHISREQLVAEVKGTYPGLVLVEPKCIDMNDKQAKKVFRIRDHRLSEDFAIRVQAWVDTPYSRTRFSDGAMDEDRRTQLPQRSKTSGVHDLGKNLLKKISKVRRGLASFVNGARLSVIADTGATVNVISAAYAKEKRMIIERSSSSFKLGNSGLVDSLGTVTIDYAFAEKPSEIFKIICHVLTYCIYDLILGNTFLTATQTMSKYRRRLTECLFSVVNVFHFGYMGNSQQFLEGTLAGQFVANAIPDTGAERNVMDLQYAIDHNFKICNGLENCGYLQFADGTYQETVGRVHTYWTFKSGERIPITFEVLQNCCSDLIIGEDILWDYDVFEVYASSITTQLDISDSYSLAPFGWESGWQKKLFGKRKAPDKDVQAQGLLLLAQQTEEQRRREWNYRYSFGDSANDQEQAAEDRRRELYRLELLLMKSRTIKAENINTAPVTKLASKRSPWRRLVGSSAHHNQSLQSGVPLIPSIPTASMSTSPSARPQLHSRAIPSRLNSPMLTTIHDSNATR